MKSVCDFNMCTGCGACMEICPMKAIRIEDSIKSMNAFIDEAKCIHCGKCERVCQQFNFIELAKPIKWFQGWIQDSSSRVLSSSGGFAYAIMEQFIKEKGVVCSCVFENGGFYYKVVDAEKDLGSFRGSKYVKSNPSGVYLRILNLLKDGKKVLFVGLPCHVGGLKKFVGDRYYDQLYTIDLICHGSPSQSILAKFFIEKGVHLQELESIGFRQNNRFGIRFKKKDKNEMSIVPVGVRDRYTIGFLNGLFYTDNCYSCKYARLERVSDITIGDSWGSDLESTEEGRNGISLALCQTERGVSLLKRSNVYLIDVDLEKAVGANHQLSGPSQKPKERELFLSLIKCGKTVSKSVAKCYPRVCIRQDIKTILTELHLMNRNNTSY